MSYYDKKPILHCKCDFLLEVGFMQNLNLGVWLFLVISRGGIMNFASIIHDTKFATHWLVYVPYTSIPISSFYDINLWWFQAKNWQCMKPPFDVMQSFILKWGMVLVFFLRLKILFYYVICRNHLKKSRCWN